MYKPEYVLGNSTHKILYEFEIQTDNIILARRPDLVLFNKKKRTCHHLDFAVLADLKVKMKESKKINKYLVLAR